MIKKLIKRFFHKKNHVKVFQGKPMPPTVPPYMEPQLTFSEQSPVSSAQITHSIASKPVSEYEVNSILGLNDESFVFSADLASLAHIVEYNDVHTDQQHNGRDSSNNGNTTDRTTDSIAGSYLQPEDLLEMLDNVNLSEESEIGFSESSVSRIGSYLKVSSIEEDENESTDESHSNLNQGTLHDGETFFDALCHLPEVRC